MENKHFDKTHDEYIDISSDSGKNMYIDDDFVFQSSTANFEKVSDGYSGMAPRRSHFAKSEQKGFFSKFKIPIIITSIVLAIAIVVGTLFATGVFADLFYHPEGSVVNDNGDFTYLSDMSVSGIDISGKTYSEAKQLLESQSKKFITPFELTVTAADKTYNYTQDNFTYTFNIDEVLENAKNYCVGVSEGNIKPTKPENDENGNPIEYYSVTATVTADSVNKIVDAITEEVNVKPVNARVSKFTPYAKNRFEYDPGSTGKTINKDSLTSDITTFIATENATGTVTANVVEVEPEITLEMVKANIVPLAYYTTTATAAESSVHNMGVALKACNGSVIEPGATWSFNDCTGNSNLESNGYVAGGVIVGGSMSTGVGGGLCQASTTLYNAGVFANMEIVERYNHFWASTYVPAGFDATIDYPTLDLKMKNTTKYQMFIECRIDGRKLMCNIYGYQDPSYDDIKTYSENYDVSSGKSYSTRSYRILLKDGKEVLKEQLPSSYYSLSGGHYVQYADGGTHRVKPNEADTIERPANTNVSYRDDDQDSSSSSSSSSRPQSSSSTSSSTSSATSSTTKPTQAPTQETTQAPTEAPTSPPETDPPAPDPTVEATQAAEADAE